MKHYRRLFLSLALLASIMLFAGCTPEIEEVTEPEETVVAEEEDSNEEQNEDCDLIREELAALQTEYENLQTEYSDLEAEFDGLSADYDKLSTDYSQLSADYDELSDKYDAATQAPAELTEGAIEQAIFERINSERDNNDLDELVWSDGIYQWARAHSMDMAERKTVAVSDESYWQDVFQAAGYSTPEGLTDAVFIIWKDRLQYEMNFLNQGAEYGAVGVYKSGDIFYVTYFASVYK